MRIGIDLGGTKTEIVCLHTDNGKELYRQRVPSPKDDYQETIRNMAAMVRLAEETTGQTGTVGVGIPGTISRITGNVKNANSTWLNGNPLDKDLSTALGRDVRVENDANCFALSEATDGAGEGHDIVFGVIIGTGCGAGLTIRQKVINGVNGITGEWGHNPLPIPLTTHPAAADNYQIFDEGGDPEKTVNNVYKDKARPDYFTAEDRLNEYPGPQCYCGKRGCLETWISGTGFKQDYERTHHENLSTHDIVAAAHKGEEKAVKALGRYADRLARGLAGVINILDPDIIILGGGMGNIQELYTQIPQIWGKYIFSDTIHTKIAPPRYSDSSGVRGAAWLWNN